MSWAVRFVACLVIVLMTSGQVFGGNSKGQFFKIKNTLKFSTLTSWKIVISGTQSVRSSSSNETDP